MDPPAYGANDVVRGMRRVTISEDNTLIRERADGRGGDEVRVKPTPFEQRETCAVRLERLRHVGAGILPSYREEQIAVEQGTRLARHNSTPVDVGECNGSMLHCGLPWGRHVQALGWTDNEIKHLPNEASQRARIARAIVFAIDSCTTTNAKLLNEIIQIRYSAESAPEPLPERTAVIVISREDDCGIFYPFVKVYVFSGEGHMQHMADVEYCGTEQDVEEPFTRMLLREVLCAVQDVPREYNIWPADFVVLQEAGLSAIKSASVRSASSCKSVEGAAGVSLPMQCLDSTGEYIPTKRSRVDCIYYSHAYGVNHGRVSASDVPPALIVGLGTNGGKSITATVMVVRTCWQGILLHTTSTTAGTDRAYASVLQYNIRAPCMRDGLFSPTACSALYGDGNGSLYVTVDGVKRVTATALTGLMSSSFIGAGKIITTRDLASVSQAVCDIAQLQGWEFAAGRPGIIYVYGPDCETREIRVEYGPDFGPRWTCLLVDEVPCMETADSELAMDHGCSGLGRYMLRDYTRHGSFVNCQKIRLASDGRFGSLRRTLMEEKNGVLSGLLKIPTNYVIDLEYMQRKVGVENQTYVYALGLAKFIGGNCVGSALMIDNAKELDDFTAANPLASKHEIAKIKRLRELPFKETGDVMDALRFIQQSLLLRGDARVYAKGRDNDEGVLLGRIVEGTRLFRRGLRSKGTHPLLLDLGCMMPNMEELAKKKGWDSFHNPAAESVLFGHAGGLCDKLPAESEVGWCSVKDLVGVSWYQMI